LEEKRLKDKRVYIDPLINNQSEDFFRIEKKYLSGFWELSDTEMLIYLNLWLYNKEENQYQISNKELQTMKFKGDTFQISKSNTYNILHKLEELGMVNIEGERYNRKIFYNYTKNENYRNIPIQSVLNYLQSQGKHNIKLYIYFLFKFYNMKNLNTKEHGLRKFSISYSKIKKELNIKTNKTIRKFLRKMKEEQMILVEEVSGKPNRYYLPIILNSVGLFKGKNGEKIIARENIEKKQNKKQNSKEVSNSKNMWVDTTTEKNEIRSLQYWNRKYGKETVKDFQKKGWLVSLEEFQKKQNERKVV